MPEDFHTWPAKKDIQQSAAKSVECWNDCYVFCVFYRNGGTRSVGNRLGAG